jgi:3-methyladenine DNA glycosylase Tag
MEEQISQMPKWWYYNKRPSSDDAYFENLCRIIFQTGLNWSVIDKKWSTIKQAFCGFNVAKVASFGESDVKRLLSNKGVIRNPYKIHAIIVNAKKFGEIASHYGSFKAYLDHQDKSDNYAKIVKELADNFERIVPITASLFLLSVGEKIIPSKIY